VNQNRRCLDLRQDLPADAAFNEGGDVAVTVRAQSNKVGRSLLTGGDDLLGGGEVLRHRPYLHLSRDARRFQLGH
jgi:hypothetical protein